MKKTGKSLGFIAIVALIGFAAISMIDCSSPGESGGNNGKTVDKIEITNPPTKLHYNLGEDLDLTGMVVTATYTDGTEEDVDVNECEIFGYDKNTAGHHVITVKYKDKTDEFSVTVVDPTLPTVATPTANPAAGTYDEVISVELSTTTTGAVIYYTTDGSEPSEESDVYTTAIHISETTTIKAFAVLAGYNDSDELEAEYILILPFTSAPELSLEPDNAKITYTWTDSDPVADSYDVHWKQGSGLSADEVKTGTIIENAVSGGVITGLTNETAYSVIVTAHKTGYTSIDSAVDTATPSPPYIITSSSTTSFTATQSGVTIGTANQPIQNVIDAIKTHANGKACIIQFVNGETALDIGTATASFNNTSGTWGLIELAGKITGSSTTATTGTIAITDAVSITSMAEITNTASNANARAIYNNSTGTLTISGGIVQATQNNTYAIYNNSTGTVNISSGEVKAVGGRAIHNQSTGAVNISGGTVSATTGYAVYNNNTGKITVSGTATVTSAYSSINNGTICLGGGTGTDVRLEITGGTVENTAATNGVAVYNNTYGEVSISGGTISATTSYTINNYSSGTLTISGGEVKATTGRAIYNYSNGAVNISGGTVSAGNGYAVYSNSTGKITVSDTAKVTSAYANNGNGTIYLGSSTNTAVRLEITGGTVENTAATLGNAVYNISNGAVTISGGTVSGTTNNAVYNVSSGSLTISGGEIKATTGRAVNNSTGTVTISGGTVFATTGNAVSNSSTGKIIVSGTSKVTSANSDANQGTIFLASSSPGTDTQLEISGGTIENTNNGNAIFNSVGGITLNGNPNITGAICTRAGTLSTGSNFAPATKIYTLDFTNLPSEIAVAGAGSFSSNFTLKTTVIGGVTVSLIVKGSDLVLSSTINNGYTVTGTGPYVINKGAGTLPSAQAAIESIKTLSGGAACTIQFGDNTTALDIGDGSISLITFDSGWTGLVTLTGKLTSAATVSTGIIRLIGSASVDSKAELTATAPTCMLYNDGTGNLTVSGGKVSMTASASSSSNSTYAVYNNSTGTANITGGTVSTVGSSGYGYGLYNRNAGTVTVSGGEVSTTGGTAVYISSGTGTINISGGTVQATEYGGKAVYNYSATVNISNGIVKATSSYAVENAAGLTNGSNTVNITGGTISTTSADTLYNNYNGKINISGGTISSETSSAINNYGDTGKITVSQASGATTLITSGNTNTSRGTILLGSPYNVTTNVRLEITGGTISNTSTGANGNAIYNGSVSAITMSGGTVSTTATSGRAILNNTTGALTISAGAVTAPVNSTAYSIYNNSTGVVTVTSPPAVITGARYPAP
jgi:hypothetical protein